jgi:hypothetical protein
MQSLSEEIPEEILFDGFDHRRPYPGDHGILFAPANARAAQIVSVLFAPYEGVVGVVVE